MGSDFQYTNIMNCNNIIAISIEILREKKTMLSSFHFSSHCVFCLLSGKLLHSKYKSGDVERESGTRTVQKHTKITNMLY